MQSAPVLESLGDADNAIGEEEDDDDGWDNEDDDDKPTDKPARVIPSRPAKP